MLGFGKGRWPDHRSFPLVATKKMLGAGCGGKLSRVVADVQEIVITKLMKVRREMMDVFDLPCWNPSTKAINIIAFATGIIS